MRQTFFLSIALLISACVFGQGNPTNKTLDLNVIGSLVANKATVHEVTDKFGQATEELVRPDHTLLQYKLDDNLYLLKFDKERKLYDFVFVNQSKKQPELSYSDIKQARNFATKAEIKSKLGQPTQVTANDKNEVWYYTVEENTAAQKTLIVRFDLSAPSVVKSYNYYADSDDAAAFSSEVINSFIKGATSSTDIENKLGKPSKIILDSESENWYYTSKNTTLIVYFDKQSRVNDFLYQRSSK